MNRPLAQLRNCLEIKRTISPRQINRKSAIEKEVVSLYTTPFSIADFRRFRAGQMVRFISRQFLRLCRFWGSLLDLLRNLASVDFGVLLRRLFASFLKDNINIRILSLKKETKIGQNNPQNRRSLSYARGLFVICVLSFCSECVLADLPKDYSQQLKPVTVKVLISEAIPKVTLEVKGCYHIFDPETQLPIASSSLGKRAEIFVKNGDLQWDDLPPTISQMRIVPGNATSSILVDGIEYRGCIEIYQIRGRLSIVNEVDVENFLKSTLAVAGLNFTDPTLLESVAIVARTNAYFIANLNASKEWYLKAEECAYLGYGVTLQNLHVDRAVEKTKQMVLTYKGKPFPAVWTENSAGRTANFSSIFRKQTSTPGGVAAPLAAKDREKHHWALSLTKQEIANLLQIPKIATITPYFDQQSEKVYAVRLSDENSSCSIDFFTLQKKLGGLRSNDFEVKIKGEKVLFYGWGTGHGVGLCLYSASQMAEKKQTMEQILTAFFPDTQLKKIELLQDLKD